MASLGFIGVGKLGQACAEMVAEVHDVVGYDISARSPENFKMVPTLEQAVQGQDIVFIAVETPHDPQYDGKAPTSHLPCCVGIFIAIISDLTMGPFGGMGAAFLVCAKAIAVNESVHTLNRNNFFIVCVLC
jgi:UDP-glucose 6-dehydrogenase